MKFLFVIIALSFLIGCESIKQSSKYQFNEGFYRSRLYHKKVKQVYIIPGEDSIKVYSAKRLKLYTDTLNTLKISFPSDKKPFQFENYTFKRNTFDFDAISVLFKYRPPVKDFPAQFNTTLNGAAYIGYRSDIYKLLYRQTPFHNFKRSITHYGYSMGVFSGIGAARIDPFVTRNNIDIEYDGVVNLTGIALIMAIDKLSFGLTLGEDYLMDRNRKYWINQHKAWLGLSIGLNLN